MSARRSAKNAAFAEAAPVFAALGAATRLKVVSRLCSDGPTSTAGLSHGHRRDPAGDHQAPRHARSRGRRPRVIARDASGSGKSKRARLAKARRCLDEIGEQWDAAIDRLRALVEDSS